METLDAPQHTQNSTWWSPSEREDEGFVLSLLSSESRDLSHTAAIDLPVVKQ